MGESSGGYAMVKLKSVNKIFFLLLGIISVLGVAAIDFPTVHAFASEKDYQRVVIIGDPHLPGGNTNGTENTVKDINAWSDVDMVAVVGDVCEELGTRDEYAYAKQFFGKMQKPAYFIVGNHDYIYADHKSRKGRKIQGSPGSRESKLQLFKKTFRLPSVYYKKQVGNYLLIFYPRTIYIHTI